MTKLDESRTQSRNGRFTVRMIVFEIVVAVLWSMMWTVIGTVIGVSGWPIALASGVSLFILLMTPYWGRRREAMWQLDQARMRALKNSND